MRTQAQKRMMKKTSAVNFIPRQQPISEEFIERMCRLRDQNGEVPDFLTELYKWAMECKCFEVLHHFTLIHDHLMHIGHSENAAF